MKDAGHFDERTPGRTDDIPTAQFDSEPESVAEPESNSDESPAFNNLSDDLVHANLRRIPIGIGEGDWMRSLSKATHESIELKNNDAWLALLALGGILAMVGAIVLAVIYVPGMFQGQVRKPVQAGAGIVILFSVGLIGACCLFSLGGRWVLTQADRTLSFFNWSKEKTHIEIQSGYHLVLVMSPPDKDGDQNCSMEMHNHDCTKIHEVMSVLSTQPAAGFLARLAGRAATMFNIPLRLRGEINRGHKDLKLWWGLYQRLADTGKLELPEDFDEEGIADYAQTVGLPTWTKVLVGVVIVSMLSSFAIVSWMKALMWIGSQGIGLLLFFVGLNALKTGEAEGKHGERYSEGKARFVGGGQLLAGLIFIIAMPVVLLFSPEPKGWGYLPINDIIHFGANHIDSNPSLSFGASR